MKIGIWHISFFTLKKFRGKGLGLKLIQLSNNSYDFAMVLSGSEGTENIYRHIGGKTLTNLKRHIKILEKEKIEKFLQKKISVNDNMFETEKKLDDNLLKVSKIPLIKKNLLSFFKIFRSYSI